MLFFLEKCPSTQDHAKNIVKLGFSQAFGVCSSEQTAGYGQYGRNWISLRNNLFLTLYMPCPKHLTPFQFSIALGVLMVEIFDKIFPKKNISLKWPNDILREDKKIGGILIENDPPNMFVGIGLNLFQAPKKCNGTLLADKLCDSFSDIQSLSKNIGLNTRNERLEGCSLESIIPQFLALFLMDRIGKAFREPFDFAIVQNKWLGYAQKSFHHWQSKTNTPQGELVGVDSSGKLCIKDISGLIHKLSTACIVE